MIVKAVVPFERVKVVKEEFENAECSECRCSWFFSKQELEEFKPDMSINQFRGYAYIFGGENHGGLQLCQRCFDKLGKILVIKEKVKK
jgi:hypothetical protein